MLNVPTIRQMVPHLKKSIIYKFNESYKMSSLGNKHKTKSFEITDENSQHADIHKVEPKK